MCVCVGVWVCVGVCGCVGGCGCVSAAVGVMDAKRVHVLAVLLLSLYLYYMWCMCVVCHVLYPLCGLWLCTVVFGHNSMYRNNHILHVHCVLGDGSL